MKYPLKKTLLVTMLTAASLSSYGNTLLNDMQTCQAMLEFVDTKLGAVSSKYDKEKIAQAREGLKSYHTFIQQNVMSPGLAQFSQNDPAKAEGLRQQIYTYKRTLKESLNNRYPQDAITMDQVVAINNCTKKSLPGGSGLEALKSALLVMVDFARAR